MSRTGTIKDSRGDVWTGRVVSSGPDDSDVLAAILTAGLSVPLTDIDKMTVRVNGSDHTGHKVK